MIDGKEVDVKCPLDLSNGLLEYKSEITYLGAIISDTGSINNDVERYIEKNKVISL